MKQDQDKTNGERFEEFMKVVNDYKYPELEGTMNLCNDIIEKRAGKMTEEEWQAAEKGLPFKQLSLYEHKETIATADTPISSQTSTKTETTADYVDRLFVETLMEFARETNSVPYEISDEEIMEAAYKYAEVYQCPTEIKMCKHDVISAWNKAIQWYREQLKKK